MTTLTLSPGIAPARPQLLARMIADEPILTRLGILLALSLAATLAAAQIDTRTFLGENIWIKPIKFQLSLALYTLTLGFFARYMPSGFTARRGWRIYMAVVTFCILAEMAWIGGAAAAGTGSHFNVASPAMQTIYSLMGLFAVTLTSASLVMGLVIRANARSGLSPAVHLAIWAGLVLTFVLTVPVAGYMASGTGHFVGTPVTDARLPVIGWSREVGDLRIAHFFAAHAMHFIPVGGLVAAALLPARLARPAVIGGILTFVAFTAFTFVLALNGQPLIG